jgi:hypothetical protein
MAVRFHRFQATIYRIWMMRHIDVPDDVARELQKQMGDASTHGERSTKSARAQSAKGGASAKKRPQRPIRGGKSGRANGDPRAKYIPVVAIVNGKLARTTLVPAGGGRFRMQINTALRKAAGADVGDLVGVELRLDGESRDLPLPPDLRAGLGVHPKAWKTFEALAPGLRRQVIKYFDSAKSPAARSRRLARMIDFLLERALLGGDRHSRAARGRRARPKRVTL